MMPNFVPNDDRFFPFAVHFLFTSAQSVKKVDSVGILYTIYAAYAANFPRAWDFGIYEYVDWAVVPQ